MSCWLFLNIFPKFCIADALYAGGIEADLSLARLWRSALFRLWNCGSQCIPFALQPFLLCDFSSSTPILPDHVFIFAFICCFEPAFASLPLYCLEQQKGNGTSQDLKQLIPRLLESLYRGEGGKSERGLKHSDLALVWVKWVTGRTKELLSDLHVGNYLPPELLNRKAKMCTAMPSSLCYLGGGREGIFASSASLWEHQECTSSWETVLADPVSTLQRLTQHCSVQL